MVEKKEKNNQNDDTTIPLKKTTRDRLKKLGSMDDSYDSLLNKLMDNFEEE